MPPIVNTHRRLSDWLAGETDMPPYYGRDEIQVVAGEDMQTGTLIGKITATGEYAAWSPAAVDGAQNAAGILVTDFLSGETSTPQDAVGLFRGPATVKEAGILWPDGATDPQKSAAVAALAANGIIVRQSA